MAKCSVCGKGVQFGHNVSHSNRKTNRVWKPNVQKVRCVVDGQTKRLNVCTRCLRSGKVDRAISIPSPVALEEVAEAVAAAVEEAVAEVVEAVTEAVEDHVVVEPEVPEVPAE